MYKTEVGLDHPFLSPENNSQREWISTEGTRCETGTHFQNAILSKRKLEDDMITFYRGTKTNITSKSIRGRVTPFSGCYRGIRYTADEKRKSSKILSGMYRGNSWAAA